MPTSMRPCRMCHRWYQPDPRQGGRQHTCDREACQRERHRRACEAGRVADRKRERQELLCKRLVAEDDRPATTPGTEVLGSRPRDAVPARVTVKVRELLKVLGSSRRDAVTTKTNDESVVVRKVLSEAPRDATDSGGPAP